MTAERHQLVAAKRALRDHEDETGTRARSRPRTRPPAMRGGGAPSRGTVRRSAPSRQQARDGGCRCLLLLLCLLAPRAGGQIDLRQTTVSTLATTDGRFSNYDYGPNPTTFMGPGPIVYSGSFRGLYVLEYIGGPQGVLIGAPLAVVLPSGVISYITVDYPSGGGWFVVGMAVDSAGNAWVVDAYNNTLAKISQTGSWTTVASTGLSRPANICCAPDGGVYVTESPGYRVLHVSPAGNMSTLAGSLTSGYADGVGTAAGFTGASRWIVGGQGSHSFPISPLSARSCRLRCGQRWQCGCGGQVAHPAGHPRRRGDHHCGCRLSRIRRRSGNHRAVQ